jgi:hypothetical protein
VQPLAYWDCEFQSLRGHGYLSLVIALSFRGLRDGSIPRPGPSLGAKVKFLSFNRTQTRSAAGLLTGHNTLRRHLHLLGLVESPLCRKYGVKEETSVHILCECEALASLRHVHLGSFFLEPKDIKSINLGAIWNFSKVNRAPMI